MSQTAIKKAKQKANRENVERKEKDSVYKRVTKELALIMIRNTRVLRIPVRFSFKKVQKENHKYPVLVVTRHELADTVLEDTVKVPVWFRVNDFMDLYTNIFDVYSGYYSICNSFVLTYAPGTYTTREPKNYDLGFTLKIEKNTPSIFHPTWRKEYQSCMENIQKANKKHPFRRQLTKKAREIADTIIENKNFDIRYNVTISPGDILLNGTPIPWEHDNADYSVSVYLLWEYIRHYINSFSNETGLESHYGHYNPWTKDGPFTRKYYVEFGNVKKSD